MASHQKSFLLKVLYFSTNKPLDLEARDKDGRTPMLQAVASSNEKCFEIILDHLHDNFEVVDNFNQSALHLAVQNDNLDIVKVIMLLNHMTYVLS